MGQFLSSPVTKKESSSGGDDFLKFGLSSMQGWRVSMEDAHCHVLDLNSIISYKDKDADDMKAQKLFDEQVSFFGVFDGHGGSRVAAFAGLHLPSILKDQSKLLEDKQYAKALQNAFLNCDEAILDDVNMKDDNSGCAATTMLFTKSQLVCANSGDSRVVLSINGNAKAMSYDHKPNNEGEKARIVAAGGFVDVGRVNGNLALSRCIGDFDFKKSADLPAEEQIVTAFPEIIEHDLNYDNDEFVILACDGIWDCLTSQECVELVRYGISQKLTLEEISEHIIDVCVAPNSMGTGIGCDNMSICIVALLDGKSMDQWYTEINKKIEIEREQHKNNEDPNEFLPSFNEVRKSIYKNLLDEADEEDDHNLMSINGNESAGNEISKSLTDLLNSSAATLHDGTYYIDPSNSSALLQTLGLFKDPHAVEDEDEANVEEEDVDVDENIPAESTEKKETPNENAEETVKSESNKK